MSCNRCEPLLSALEVTRCDLVVAPQRQHAASAVCRLNMYTLPIRREALSVMQVQNIRPGFKLGLWAGLANTLLESYIHPVLLGGSPWRWSHNFPDHSMTQPAKAHKQPQYDECVVLLCVVRRLRLRATYPLCASTPIGRCAVMHSRALHACFAALQAQARSQCVMLGFMHCT